MHETLKLHPYLLSHVGATTLSLLPVFYSLSCLQVAGIVLASSASGGKRVGQIKLLNLDKLYFKPFPSLCLACLISSHSVYDDPVVLL